ncbi:UDP-4-amino-4,6-dideoxy-N-acetyl-beta-L-altrosamine N-acetyltransferase [Bacillus bingmayongensis]|uniref:UDP-4-amino-4, 6-dideoxy-N-acetyl-beta-L-altrosamine N-acetyltransferase n=1 Tax=Bacillus bingmayongensis TaxID=1150157 RepID=UPI001C8EA5AA|nr:UDP-4-amino-4,6-dideoxy-N-acetyl-beta-L-altrosamine N-acetyltransferase [Bacillus bingmayongensis]MBY0600235.1 UDP-4-amino-4,6-dideoxy-N-acetyl-beta-L-altrosamine N-acetyltransferase [Bacillus bingmayongensis]
MNVCLRKIEEKDLEMIMNWRTLPEITKYMYTDPILTLEDQIKWYKKIMASDAEKYWIIRLEDGTDVGVLSLNNIDIKNKHCSWGYYIADLTARGKGLGRILECNIYDYVFFKMNLNKLWGEVFEFNEKVIKIHERFGSRIEGKLREHIHKNGEFYDVVRVAITKKEWKKIKSTYEYDLLNIMEY